MKSGSYDVAVKCGNCGHFSRIEIPHGTPVAVHPCPKCGCATLSKSAWRYP